MISRGFGSDLLPFLSFRTLELYWTRLRFRDVDVARFDELSGDFPGVTSIFWTLWNQRFLWFRFGFQRLNLLFLQKRIVLQTKKLENLKFHFTFFFNFAYFAISICSSSVKVSGMWMYTMVEVGNS
jgi:hypothetical protein